MSSKQEVRLSWVDKSSHHLTLNKTFITKDKMEST